MKETQFVFGLEVKDTISGFVGKITARIEYISGCVQYAVAPKVGKEGRLPPAEWFDEDRLVPTERDEAPKQKDQHEEKRRSESSQRTQDRENAEPGGHAFSSLKAQP